MTSKPPRRACRRSCAPRGSSASASSRSRSAQACSSRYQLWKWNNIVALVLSVLVILGLVVGVRVVRKTEDIGSTLIAVAVGALVTLGPLALLQSG